MITSPGSCCLGALPSFGGASSLWLKPCLASLVSTLRLTEKGMCEEEDQPLLLRAGGSEVALYTLIHIPLGKLSHMATFGCKGVWEIHFGLESNILS